MEKKHFLRYYGNYIFYCITFSLFEAVLRLSTPGRFDVTGFIFASLFNIIIALVFCGIMSFVRGKVHVAVNNIFLSLIAALYISQIIYYYVFGTYYNTESMFNAGQITQFWIIILRAIWERLIYIVLCVVPVPLYNIFVRKQIISPEGKHKIILAVCSALYIILLVALIPFAVEPFSSYSMFFGQQDYEDSIKRTGFLSTLHVDLIKNFVPQDTTGALSGLEELREMQQNNPPVMTPKPSPEASPAPSPGNDPGSSGEQGTPGEEEPPPPEPVVYGYNEMDIDFESLIKNASRDSIRVLHEYISNEIPSQQNEYTGMFEGYNLIMFVAEAFSPFAVREDLTPTLYKLVHEGFHFTEFYTPSWRVSTSDGEYVACTGLLPKSGVWSFYQSHTNYLPFVMGNQLRNLGYETFAYHNHTHTYYRRHLSHPNMGYEYKGVGNGLELPRILWPNSDLEMMQATINEYIHNQPFHAYYMTVSGHFEYTFDWNAMSKRNREAVEHLPYPEANKAYIACNIELEKALTFLIRRLNEANIAEKTVIVLSTDHYPYGLDSTDGISEFLGYPVDTEFEIYKNHLIIYAQGMEPVTVDKPSSSLDIIPTISNLMGLEFDSRLLMGRDILSDSDPLVIFANRSFITGYGYKIRGEDFVPNPGVDVDDSYADYIAAVIEAKFSASASILELDYYRIVFSE